MGNTSSSVVDQCLATALGGNSPNQFATSKTPLWQLSHVHPWNLDVDVSPAAITYPRTAEQVAAVVKCAADNGLKVQPRSGGHSYQNFWAGGVNSAKTIVVDLKNIKHFSIDRNSWVATFGGGTLLGDVTKQLSDNGGRAIAHGTCPQVGLGGHATMGGLGPTSRQWGTTMDHVLEAQVVLANSTIVRASETQNSDLFFAVKGAGASFGIVTEFKMRTQPKPSQDVVYQFNIVGHDTATKAKAFKSWLKWIADPNLSRKFASQFILSDIGAVIYGTYFGSKAEFDALNITSKFPESDDTVVVKDWLGTVADWAVNLSLQLVGTVPSNYYSKSFEYTANDILSDQGVDNLLSWIDNANKGTPIWFVIFDLAGGAINDVAPDKTAYAHRDTLFYSQSYAVNLFGKVTPTIRNFLEDFNANIKNNLPNSDLGAYPGYVDTYLPNAQVAYWGDNYPRLQQVKGAWDPNDVFQNPQSVKKA